MSLPSGSASVVTADRAPQRSRRPAAFPELPAAWYRFGDARDFGPTPRAIERLGRRWVGFRAASGAPVVLADRCAHMAADLAGGRVEGETLVCPYHGWAYGRDGACARIPGRGDAPSFARVASLPVAERHGHVFAFAGTRPAFPLPGFEGAGPLRAARRIAYRMESPAFLVCGNAFDLSHLVPVHGRRIVGRAAIDEPARHARRIRYESEVVGRRAADRWVRRLAGPRAAISITVWAGVLAVVEAKFARATSRIFVSVHPEGPDACSIDVLPLRPESTSRLDRLVAPLSLALRRALTCGFLAQEIAELSGARLDRERTTELDAELCAYADWYAGLPAARLEEPSPDPAPTGGRP